MLDAYQLSLLERHPRTLAHRDDPETAKDAAAGLGKSVTRRLILSEHDFIFTSLGYIGLSDDEAAQRTGIELHEARRRSSDLRNAGLIEWLVVDGKRITRPSAGGKRSTVSIITDAGREALL